MYLDRVKSSFDIDVINNSGLNFAYDAMYGAGQNVMKKLSRNDFFVDYNPSFKTKLPSQLIKI